MYKGEFYFHEWSLLFVRSNKQYASEFFVNINNLKNERFPNKLADFNVKFSINRSKCISFDYLYFEFHIIFSQSAQSSFLELGPGQTISPDTNSGYK